MIFLNVSNYLKERDILLVLAEMGVSDSDFFIIFYRWLRFHRTGLTEFECAEYAKDYQETLWQEYKNEKNVS